MIALYVVFAALMGCTCLMMLALVAALLVESLYRLYPWISQYDVDLGQPVRMPAWIRRRKDSPVVQEQENVVFARSPLRRPEYFIGLADREPVFAHNKTEARRYLLEDKLALRSWSRFFGDRMAAEVYVCKCVLSKEAQAKTDRRAVSRSLGPELAVTETHTRRTVVNRKWIFLE